MTSFRMTAIAAAVLGTLALSPVAGFAMNDAMGEIRDLVRADMIEIGADVSTLETATLAQLSGIQVVLDGGASEQVKKDEIDGILGTPVGEMSAKASDEEIDPALVQFQREIVMGLTEQGIHVEHPDQLTLKQLAELQTELENGSSMNKDVVEAILKQ